MSTNRMCSSCYFNNHATAEFCTQCGKPLTEPAASSSTTEELVPHQSPEAPHTATENALERIVAESGYSFSKTKAGYKVVVPLGDKRKQKVHVLFTGHDDDGHDVISFISICAKANEKYAMSLLRLNNKMTYGAFGTKTIKGDEYFVVTANQLAETADPEEVSKQLFEVARRADAVESLLSKGKDVF